MRFRGFPGLRVFELAVAVSAFLSVRPTGATPPLPASAFGDAVWVAQEHSVLKVGATDGRILFEIGGVGDVGALAVDPVRSTVWAFGPDLRLRSYDFAGSPMLSETLSLHGGHCDDPDDDDDGRKQIVIDSRDGSAWLAFDGTIVHVDAAGVVRGTLSSSGRIRGIAFDESAGRLWVGTKRALTAYDSAFHAVATVTLGRHDRLRGLDIDHGSQDLFVALDDRIEKRDAAGAVLLSIPIHGVLRVAADSRGGAWCSTQKTLIRIGLTGTIDFETSPFAKKITAIVGNPLDSSGWVSSRTALEEIGADAQVLETLDLGRRADIRALALYVDTILPTLHIDTPADGALLADARPVFGVSYSDVGGGVDLSTLAFRRGSLSIATTCETSASSAVCTPAVPFPQGPSTVTASISDHRGNVTSATVHIAIDSIAPILTVTAPSDGALTNAAQQHVTGSLSELAALTLNGAAVLLAADLSFDATAMLSEGANTLSLRASDVAGNITTRDVRITLDTTAPGAPNGGAISITAPAGGTVTVSGSAGSVEGGATIIVTDTTTGASATTIANADGSFSVTIAAGGGNALTVVARDPAGNSSAATSKTVPGSGPALPPDPSTIAPPLDRTVPTNFFSATRFLYAGPNAIQTGVAPGAVAPRTAAVLQGRVLARGGAPLPGATISVLGHPELGQTLSRADGRFDLAVNGGVAIEIQFSAAGYLSSNRHVTPPWQDFSRIDDVVLVAPDAISAVITVGAAAPAQIAAGSVSIDARGSRRAVLIFPAGTSATLELPDGTATPLAQLTVRLTEFTVGDDAHAAMPAELPPTTNFTYALSISVAEEDAAGPGAQVVLSGPAFLYVDDFLGFPVGQVVPNGSFDRSRASWVPEPNGRVVAILAGVGGLADVDLDGSGSPATDLALASLGFTDDERSAIAALYSSGSEVWRTPIRHLSPPYDLNAPEMCEGACEPPPKVALDEPVKDPCETAGGSTIECENQTLAEDFSVVGAPFTLHLQSDRQAGRADRRHVIAPVTSAVLPPGIVKARAELRVAGKSYETRYEPPQPNQSFEATWDGRDAYGRLMAGDQPATLFISYVFLTTYAPAGAGAASFGSLSSDPSIIITVERDEITLTRVIQTTLGTLDALPQALGGADISIHHSYSPATQTLYEGNGRRRSGRQIAPLASLGAGLGASDADGVLATHASTQGAHGVTLDPRGGYFYTDGRRVRHVDEFGIVTTVAGSFLPGFVGDGGPALLAKLSGPQGIAFAPDGSLYICDAGNARVRVVRNGIIATFAGGGADFSADEIAAASAGLVAPSGIDVGPDGSVYIADPGTQMVLRVSPDGIIHRIAGVLGFVGTSPDGTPARQTLLAAPEDVKVAPDGTVYIADTQSSLVRAIGLSGRIRTVAGIYGGGGVHCEGCAATSSRIVAPRGLAIAANGDLYFSETANGNVDVDPAVRIRKVVDGRVFSVVIGRAGIPTATSSAAIASTPGDYIYSLAVSPDGVLFYVLENVTTSASVRVVHLANPAFDASPAITIASDDGAQVFVFDGNGRHLATKDALTGVTLFSFTYDAGGLLAQVADRDGNTSTISRATGRMTITAPGAEVTTAMLDANGFARAIANPAGEATLLSIRADGMLTSLTNPRGFTSTYLYDSLGRLIFDGDAAGGSLTIARSALATGSRVSETTAEGRVRRFDFDESGPDIDARTVTARDGTQTTITDTNRVLRTTIAPDGTRSEVTLHADPRFGMQTPLADSTIRTPAGLALNLASTRTVDLSDRANPFSVITQTDTVAVNGRSYTSRFDAAARTVTSTSPEGRQRAMTLDSQGRVVSAQTETLLPVALVYDTRGRVAHVSQGGRDYSFAYDPIAIDRLRSITDPLSRNVAFEYDDAGRVTRQTLPDSSAVVASYDAASNLASLTPPGRPAHSFDYSPVDLQSAYTPPVAAGDGTRSTGYSYNLDRQLTGVTRPDARTVVPVYDAAKGRITSLTWSAGTESFSYDAAGRLSAVAAPGGIGLAFGYDGPLPTSETWSGPVAGSITRTFDNDLRLASESVNGDSVPFSYDRDGLLVAAGAESIARDPATGQITGTTLGGVTTTRTYNAFGEPASDSARFGASPLYSATYDTLASPRDALGRIAHLSETIAGVTRVLDYTYDSRGRLTDVVEEGALQRHYTFDANGNRLSKTGIASPVFYVYDDQDRLLCERSSLGNDCSADVAVSYTWTANGELASKTESALGTTIYGYDELGNLRSVLLPSGTRIDYLIDGANRRIGRVVDGVLVQGFLYRNSLKPVAELDGAGNVVARFVYGSKGQVPDVIVKGGLTYRVVSDHLGTPRLIVDQGGTVVQRFDVDEWGNVTADSDPGWQPFGFDGGMFDSTTGLVRFGARDLDPRTGRWTANDPIRFRGRGSNFYEFVAGDPVGRRDPSGRAAQVCVSGNDVQINFPVFFTGPSNSPAAQKAFIDSVMTVLSRDFGPWSVSGGVTVLGSNPADLDGPFGNVVSFEPYVMNEGKHVTATTTLTGGSTQIEPGAAGESDIVGDEMRHILGYEDESGNFGRDFVKRLVRDLEDPGNKLPISAGCACTADLAGP